ncbi:putative dienelactone hydrolase [Kribbella amoyensis]|uniref:Putative dienelactone hydrolase n=1 Tax=Kribbella amoyensis TaxID=996641 RepID=A0A561BLU0_9ACTN|nr:alpha/beta hydrolase [Kribbella amoyensis]TWD79805.1 putative dienelactone hydrolase [Kribbella amoyensis]
MKLIACTTALVLTAALGVTAAALPSTAAPATTASIRTEAAVSLPVPSGRLPVGLDRFELVDRSRTDPWVPASGSRRLMVSVWYPALPTPGEPAPYLTEAEAKGLVDFRQLPLDPKAIAGVRGVAKTGTPIRPALHRYPLVVLSPGFTLPVATLTSLAQDLASKGYVVAGIDHAYESSGTEFPDGTVKSCVACEVGEAEQVPPIRAADVSFVLDHLVGPKPGWRGSRWIDARRIGMAGHSIGGNSAADAMVADPRIDAGVNLDGTFFTPLPSTGVRKPFLLVGAPGTHTPGDEVDRSWDDSWNLLTGYRRWFVLPETGHLSFTDFAPLAKRFGLPADPEAPLDGDRTDEVTRALVTGFLDHHLRGLPSAPILDGADPRYPEAVRQTP